MSIPPMPRPYETCDPEEKLQRLKVAFAMGRVTLPELERRTEEALLEEDYYEVADAGLDLTPQQLETKARLDREHEARMLAWRTRP